MSVYQGDPADARGRRFAIVASRFNEVVVQKLVDAASKNFESHECDVDVAWVPGAFELPLVARRLASTGSYGAVDYVAAAAERGILRASMETGVPVLFGVLTTETMEQAMDRAGGAHGNKGWDMAEAALEMASLMDELP